MKNAHHKSLKPAASLLLLTLISLVPPAVRAQETKEPVKQPEIVATGGSFALEKTVTAGGGNQMSQSPLNQTGTTGQAAAGVKSAGGQFTLHSGFWTPDDFAPTASQAVVGGRILTSTGAGIRNVQVTITFPSGEIRSTVSTSFGYYRFAEIPVGEIYIISVAAKKYTFSQDSQIRQVIDDLQDVDFVANE